VTNGFPATTLAGLIAQAKAKPGEVSYGSSGAGSTPHVAGELFMNVTGTKLLHVPYKGASQAIADTVAGNVEVSFDTVPAALPFVKAGRLRALAVLGSKRLPALPNVPTSAEAGAIGAEGITWYGLYGPGKLPDPIVRKLHAEMIKIVQMPEVKARLDGMGAIETTQMSPEDFAASVRSDIARYLPVLRNIKKD
jgi:tripartite-type tricarboxylate transporter receptor subunit TctC